MNEREKQLKAFNQCADALSQLDKGTILKVFHMLSIHFDVIPTISSAINEKEEHQKNVGDMPILIAQGEKGSMLTNSESKTPSSKRTSSVKKLKSSDSKNLTFLAEFDFRPPSKQSLKDFYGKFNPVSYMEKNLIFTYYYQEILHDNPITTNHIYSAYRHLSLKIPSFPQTLIDTKKSKGWIDTSNTNDLKVTRAGINYIEHDMIKNDD